MTAVGDLIHGPAEVVEVTTVLSEVIDTLSSLGIGIVVVMDGGSVAGVVSERDVVWALSQGVDPDVTVASEVMTSDLVIVEPSSSITDAASQMQQQNVRHLLVLRGPAPGVVSLRDVIDHLLS